MLTTGQVAKAVGVNIQTLRFYEREGIISAPHRTRSGYRQYPEETVRIIAFIKRAQVLGFTLKEAKELSRLRTSPRKNRLKARRAAIAKIEDINARIDDLVAIRDSLEALVSACKRDRKALRCPILEALDRP
jgi:MerR family transcriptional regulator, copper efflux regulator